MSNKTIYTSDKAMAYVYYGVHKITGKFYYGSRWANVQKDRVSSSDFGAVYRTSSKIVKPIFDEFDWIILAEFSESIDAYDFEQLCIFKSWSDPLKLNMVCYHNKKNFSGGPKTNEQILARRNKIERNRLKRIEAGLPPKINAKRGQKDPPKTEARKLELREAREARRLKRIEEGLPPMRWSSSGKKAPERTPERLEHLKMLREKRELEHQLSGLPPKIHGNSGKKHESWSEDRRANHKSGCTKDHRIQIHT